MKNKDLVLAFLQGATSGKGSNLKIEGNRLINYTTTIAYRYEYVIILNGQKYSQSTSVHQNQIRRSGVPYTELPTEGQFNKCVETILEGEVA